MAVRHFDHLEWIEQESRPLNQLSSQVFEELLLKSPALEVSCRSQGFVNRFNIHDSDDAAALFEELTSGVFFLSDPGKLTVPNANEVERFLIENDRLNGAFWERGEFAVYTIPSRTERLVSSFVERQCSDNRALKKKKAHLVQVKYQRVDALFRHIRNALAHASFQAKKSRSGDMVVFQDGDSTGKLCARFVLSAERLDKWISKIYEFDNVGV